MAADHRLVLPASRRLHHALHGRPPAHVLRQREGDDQEAPHELQRQLRVRVHLRRGRHQVHRAHVRRCRPQTDRGRGCETGPVRARGSSKFAANNTSPHDSMNDIFAFVID